MVRQRRARGDRVFVSGTIGDAALGLRVRKGELKDASGHLVSRYRVPQPRMALAEAVRAHASAAMDVSDGLAGDLAKLCRASNVSADIEVARVPLSDAAADRARERLQSDRADPDRRRGLRNPVYGRAGTHRRVPGRRCAGRAFRSPISAGSSPGRRPPRFLNPEGQALTFIRPGYSHF